MGSLLTCLAPETPNAREDRLGREAVYRATMAGHYSASTHSFERWVDVSARPPATPRCLLRKPIPEAAYGAVVFGDGRAAAVGGHSVGLPSAGGPSAASLTDALPLAVLPSVEIPCVVLPSADLPTLAGARGQRADSGLYTGEIHRGLLYRSLTPTGSARPISRILGDVRVRNVVSVKSVVSGRKSAAAG